MGTFSIFTIQLISTDIYQISIVLKGLPLGTQGMLACFFCGGKIINLLEENQAHWSWVYLQCFQEFVVGFLKHKFSSQPQDWVSDS